MVLRQFLSVKMLKLSGVLIQHLTIAMNGQKKQFLTTSNFNQGSQKNYRLMIIHLILYIFSMSLSMSTIQILQSVKRTVF